MIAQVALPLPIDKLFSYRLPDYMLPVARPLARVRVPFGHRLLVGFIVSIVDAVEEGDGLKAVEEFIDPVPLMGGMCYDLVRWASEYYATPIGLGLKFALSSAISVEKYCRLVPPQGDLSGESLTLKKACNTLGREDVYQRLGQGTFRLCDVFTGSMIGRNDPTDLGQGFTIEVEMSDVRRRFERYVSLVSNQLQQGKSCLMIVPDRHNAGEFFYRMLAKRFPGAVSWFGSASATKKRAEAYFAARSQAGRLVLGNKSAVFLPLMSLGLIIVERPEEDQYRNEDSFKFNAARLAQQRAEIERIPLVLGSVSPPLEIMRSQEEGRVWISQSRPLAVPEVSIAPWERMRGEHLGLPSDVVREISDTLKRGGNVAIHTPKRAYAAGLNCSVCGQSVSCISCGSFSVSFQRERNVLVCATCKSSIAYTERCIFCGSSFIRFFDIGAEYLETLLKEKFPDAPVIRFTGEKNGRPGRLSRNAGTGRQGTVAVGTHILSKLYTFDADLLILYGWDNYLLSGGGGFRAREKMFQVFRNLLDALDPKRVLVCASQKDPVDLSLFLDPSKFYADELAKRRMADFPPYERFFLINITKRSETAGRRVIDRIEKLAVGEGLEHRLLGPIEVSGRYAWRIVLKGDERTLSPLLSSLHHLPGVHVEADPLYL